MIGPFVVDVARVGAHVTVCPIGELDIATCPELERVLEQTLNDPATSRVTVDLRGVTFCESTGLRVMLLAQRTSTELQKELTMVRPGPVAFRAFELTGLDVTLPFDAAA
jgi:anti-sigma B factor antagonist